MTKDEIRGLQSDGKGRGALLLAAGSSSRMGSPKALLPWVGGTLIEYAVRQLAAAGCSEIVVVLGVEADRVGRAVPDVPGVRVTQVVNQDLEAGRSGSVRLGAGVISGAAGVVVIQSIDQPCPAAVVEQLCRAVELGPCLVAIPVHGGRRGHPLVVSGALLSDLRAVREETLGLRGVVRAHMDKVSTVAVDDDAVLLNLNDLETYERARQRP
ncbi:MAG: nucleotidyltransferase family protein [Chloroflexota bacterium]